MIENYNKQFLQYQINTSIYWERPSYVSDVEGLINTTIKNNKSGRKTIIIYENTNYTSSDELRQLLSIINTNKSYSVNIKYDNNYDYIESITLSSWVNESFYEFQQYEGNSRRRGDINALIKMATNSILYDKNFRINVVYTSETGQKITVNLNSDSSKKITDLRNEIKLSKTYNVEIQKDSNDVCYIIITGNN